MLLAFVTVILMLAPALSAFNYDRYLAADLDELLMRPRPKKGIDLHPVLPLRLTVKLSAYGERCDTAVLQKSLLMAGVSNDKVQITQCIQVRSSKGKQVSMFIQDEVAKFLRREVAIEAFVTLFAVHAFTSPEGPGLLVNEFKSIEGSGVPT